MGGLSRPLSGFLGFVYACDYPGLYILYAAKGVWYHIHMSRIASDNCHLLIVTYFTKQTLKRGHTSY